MIFLKNKKSGAKQNVRRPSDAFRPRSRKLAVESSSYACYRMRYIPEIGEDDLSVTVATP